MPSIPWRIALFSLLMLPPAAAGQGEQADAVPRLPWDVPDLQGIWLRQSSTPLEPDPAVADKAVLTPAEAAAFSPSATRPSTGISSSTSTPIGRRSAVSQTAARR